MKKTLKAIKRILTLMSFLSLTFLYQSGISAYFLNSDENINTITLDTTKIAIFNGNGGSDGTPIIRFKGSKLGYLPQSERDGYEFDGWYTDPVNGEKISETTLMPAEGATYYAHWKTEVYSITYDSNIEGLDINDYLDSSYPRTYRVGTSEEISEIRIDYYMFYGWTGSNGDIPQWPVKIDDSYSGDLHFTANLSPNLLMADLIIPMIDDEGFGEYTEYLEEAFLAEVFGRSLTDILRDMLGEDLEAFDRDHKYNGKATVEFTMPEFPREVIKPGYVFVGWKGVDPFDEEVYTIYQPGDIATVEFHPEFYVDYGFVPIFAEEQAFNITYDLNGGFADNPDSYNPNDSSTYFDLLKPEYQYHKFIGWTGSNGDIPEMSVSIDKSYNGNLHFVANYNPSIIKINYLDLYGNAVKQSAIYHYDGQSNYVEITLPEYTDSGSKILSWEVAGAGTVSPGKKIKIVYGTNKDYVIDAVAELESSGPGPIVPPTP